ncbi:YveK family protein [Gudongella sp. SC589]|uniref:YveK family protein n=1 Tax=Gudongella sp. SC589 TaxID=3385990 RepID=UPI0039049ED6
MEEISLREIYYILKKRMGMIIILLILSLAISAVVSFYVLDKQYQANTTLMVGRPKDYVTENKLEYNELLLNQRLVSTYGELIKTRTVADRVIENMGLSLTYNQLREKLNVSLVKDTEIIRISVIDTDPVLAAEIANETSEVFMETVQEIMKVENIQVIDTAQVPTAPIQPRPLMNIAIAGVLAVMLGVFIAFLIEFLDTTIKTPEDVEKHLGLPVIGSIPMVED